MVRIQLAILIALFPAFSWAFDFKGIEIGAAATPEQVLEKLGVACGNGANRIQVCNGSVTIARERATINLVISPAGIVQRIDITLAPEAFEVVASELIKKFGPPSKTETSELQNSYGVKYRQTLLLWLGPSETQLFYSKYAGSTRCSRLNFSTQEDRELLRKPKENRGGDL